MEVLLQCFALMLKVKFDRMADVARAHAVERDAGHVGQRLRIQIPIVRRPLQHGLEDQPLVVVVDRS